MSGVDRWDCASHGGFEHAKGRKRDYTAVQTDGETEGRQTFINKGGFCGMCFRLWRCLARHGRRGLCIIEMGELEVLIEEEVS